MSPSNDLKPSKRIVPIWLRWIPWMAAIDDAKPLNSNELERLPRTLRNDPWFWFFLKPALILIIGVVIFPKYGLMYVFDTLGWAYDPVCRDYASPRWAKCFEFEAIGWWLSLLWLYWLIKFHIKRK